MARVKGSTPPAPEPNVAGILARAFARCHGDEVNERLARLREEQLRETGHAFSYEVVVRGTGLPGFPSAPRGWRYFRDVVAPRLGYHVRALGLRAGHCPGVFLTLFDGADVYFVHASDFFQHYREVERLSDIEMARRVQDWEREGGDTE